MDDNIYKPRPVAGLNVEKHRLAITDPQGALASLGVRYNGKHQWKLPRGANIQHVGYDVEDGSDDWLLTIEEEYSSPRVYHIWSEDPQSY